MKPQNRGSENYVSITWYTHRSIVLSASKSAVSIIKKVSDETPGLAILTRMSDDSDTGV